MVSPGTKAIDEESSVSDIVKADYRTAEVFRKYGIGFCCGAKLPLRTVCEINDLEINVVRAELEQATRTICLPNILRFEHWDIDFLSDYIVNVHHQYLAVALPATRDQLTAFLADHQDKFSYLPDLMRIFMELMNYTIPHLQEEEAIIFPYIRQISHAYNNKESYGGLLVRTLRKPVENVMNHENESINWILGQMRRLTDHYIPPKNACLSHRVIFARLNEIDNDLMQHLYLETNVLFPRAIAMEKELLGAK